MIIMSFLTAAVIFGLWLPTPSNALLIVFAAVFGFVSGAGIGLTPALVAQISDIKEIGVRTGLTMGLASIAALTGGPIGGMFKSRSDFGMMRTNMA